MDLAVKRFAHEIVNDVFKRHKPGQLSVTLTLNTNLTNAPIFYNKRCEHIVSYYFSHYEDNITKYYVKDCENINESTFRNIAKKLIQVRSRHHQCSEVFYRLCVQLALLGVITYKEGCSEGLSYALQEIIPLANEAYLRCDLDEKYDSMYNFSFDVLYYVFNWAECEADWDRNLKRVDCDCGPINYFTVCSSYFFVFLFKEGRSVLKRFKKVESGNLTREAFVYRIQDYCDDYYRQLGRCSIIKVRNVFLDICMLISLLTLHTFEILYPSDFQLAHESILRLAILTARYGIIPFGRLLKTDKPEAIKAS